MDCLWVILISVLWWLYQRPNVIVSAISLGCPQQSNRDLYRLMEKRGKSALINWTLNIIHYSSFTMGSTEKNTFKGQVDMRHMGLAPIMIGDIVLCPKFQEFVKEEMSLSVIKKTLCRGLSNKKVKMTFGMSRQSKGILSYTVSGKMATNVLIQKAIFDEGQRKSPEYFVHLMSTLGIPTLTWFAGSVGNIEIEEQPMVLHFEPGNYHIAEAIGDFLANYNWNVVTVLVSKQLPGHELFLKELKRVANERRPVDHPKHLKLEISKVFYIDDRMPLRLLMKKCRKYMRPGTRVCPYGAYDKLLHQIYKSEATIIIFHGTKHDLYMLAAHYKKFNTTLFGKKYVWICTPSSTKLSSSKEAIHDANFPRGIVIEGMFGFAYHHGDTQYKKALQHMMSVWFQGMKATINSLKKDPKFNNNKTDLAKILMPNFTCTDISDDMYWKLGWTLYEKMKSYTYVNKENERIGFLDNGFVNTTELLIMNSKSKPSGNRKPPRAHWAKVGTWTMSSKEPKLTNLRIDGITFSGGTGKPPEGRPRKVKLRVATLKERPFVVYSMPNRDNECDQNTIACMVNPASMNSTGPPLRTELAGADNRTNTTKACCGGLTIDLLLEIKRDLNFDVEMFEVEDRTWGIKTEKGWNGLVKVLLDNKADMVVTSFKITPNRSAAVDFSIPFQETGITIAVALREGKISHTAFLEPYDFPSWCVILIFSVHACGAALFVYEWLSPQGLDRGNVAPREKNGSSDNDHRFSLFRSLWLIWSMLFSASVNADNPRGVASRVLASIWALFALVFLASYTANLAAFMIAKEEYYDLKGIKDFRLTDPWNQKPPFRFATVPSGATEENIRINFPSMAMYMRTYNKSSVVEGINALKNGEIDAFIYDAYVLDYMEAHDENCKLKTVRNWFAMTGYGIAFPKKSKWLKLVNERILAYSKNGKMQRWKKFWLSGNCKKSSQLGNTNKTLGVKNFISAFILLVGGMILCTVLLLLEHAFYRYMRPRIKSWDKYGCCGLVSISMGQLLSFEQSVNQTVDLIKHHKCKNPICETQLWKARHELDMARRKIRKLETAWSRTMVEQEGIEETTM